MPNCRSCGAVLHGIDETGARCPRCKEPVFGGALAGERAADAGAAVGRCAVHPQNVARGTCQRCGNYVCTACRTAWHGRAWCVGCVERALESGGQAPAEARTHLRQAGLALVFGVLAWGVALAGFVLMAAGVSGLADQNDVPADGGKAALVGFGFLILLASPVAAVLGVGQGAAAVRARGDHLIMATAGLFLSGLQVGVLIGFFVFSALQ